MFHYPTKAKHAFDFSINVYCVCAKVFLGGNKIT
jgi:hypothetical protein